MLHRYYLALLFEDATKDQSIPFGHDAGAASQMLADLTQHGGPDGICRAILYSTRRNRSVVRVIYPTASLQLQATQAQESTAKRAELELSRKRADLSARLDALKREAGELDMSDILFAPASATNSDGEHDDDEEDDDLEAGATPPALPTGTQGASAAAPAVVTAPVPPAPPAGAQGVDPAVVVPPTPPAPPAPSQASQAATKGSTPKAATKGAAQPKNTTGDAAKGTEGAADSDSAPQAPGAPGDLLEGA